MSRIDGNEAARYWSGLITRAEAQKSFDEFATVLIQMKEQQTKIDFALSYVLEKLNVKPEEVQEFMQRKVEEFAAKQTPDTHVN